MAARETPTILAASYASTTHDLGSLNQMQASGYAPTMTTNAAWQNRLGALGGGGFDAGGDEAAAADMTRRFVRQWKETELKPEPEEEEMATTRRLVQVYICDGDENVPLDDAMIYSGEQHLTDMDDNELFFQIDLRERLKSHNEKRVKMVDKSIKERIQYLEPARIRDLKMVVVCVARF